MRQRFFKLAMIPALLALVALAAATAPASAHQSEVSHGNDFAVTDSNHRSGAVCDMEADGHGVAARWFDSEGFTVAYEEDGGDGGCDQADFDGEAETVIVCEMILGNPSCTDPHRV